MNEVFDYVMMLHFRSKVQRFGENLKLLFFLGFHEFFFFLLRQENSQNSFE